LEYKDLNNVGNLFKGIIEIKVNKECYKNIQMLNFDKCNIFRNPSEDSLLFFNNSITCSFKISHE
jgi:hypothetical protein